MNATYVRKTGETLQVAYIAQELVGGGELFDYVSRHGPFSEADCRYFFKQMLDGIHYIHSHGFSHRDLKLDNMMLDDNYDIKIVDYGFAC